MRHIAVVVSSIVAIACWHIRIVEEESVHARAIDNSTEVVDLRTARNIPESVNREIDGSGRYIVGIVQLQSAKGRKEACATEKVDGGP